MVDIGRRLVSLGMGREVGGMGYGSFKNHVEQMKVYKWVTKSRILRELKQSSGILCRSILLYGGQSLETETGTGGVVRVLAFSGRVSSRKLA